MTQACSKCQKVLGGNRSAVIMHERTCGKEAERFWPKVDKSAGPDACWIWKGAVTSKWGYGCFLMGGRVLGAHRVAWILTNGDPGELCVLHKCDNRVCVNPAHFFLGTKKDNSQDKMRKGRHPIGERAPQAKLTEAQVREIRALYRPGNGRELGRRFGVKQSTISYIITRRHWAHVE